MLMAVAHDLYLLDKHVIPPKFGHLVRYANA
jgi:hypothetical protein